jgi:ankyrin repeat protein
MRASGLCWLTAAVVLLLAGCDKNTRHNATTDLHRAAEQGDLQQVQMLIIRGAHVNARDDRRRTPLHLAAENGHKEVAEVLVHCGAQVDSEDELGRTPADIAMARNYRAVVEYLIGEGAIVTLPLATYLGDVAKVKSLIEAGADVNAGVGTAWTALHYAARYNQRAVAELLIAGGARVDSSTKEGTTPLHTAAEEGELGMVQFLLTQGANINARDSQGATPLYVALRREHVDMVELLASSGADVNARPVYEDTALCYAAGHGLVDVVKLLLAKGANANARIAENRFRGGLPLEIAIEGGYVDIVEALVSGGADVNRKDEFGWPLLHIAITSHCQSGAEAALLSERPGVGAARADWDRYGASIDRVRRTLAAQMVRLLIAHGADIEARDKEGLTPLHCAAYQGHREIVEFLLAAGVDVNARAVRDPEPNSISRENPTPDDGFATGVTPLHAAAVSGDPCVVEVLLAHGAKIQATNESGATPLHCAVQEAKLGVVELLIAKGADVNVEDRGGATPLADALSLGLVRTAKALIAAGAKKVDMRKFPAHIYRDGACVPVPLLHRALSDFFPTRVRGSSAETADLNNVDDRREWIELLLANGADPNERDDRATRPCIRQSLWGMMNRHAFLLCMALMSTQGIAATSRRCITRPMGAERGLFPFFWREVPT